MPLNVKQAASPRVPVESPINAMGPRISNQLSLLENKSSELIQTSCIRLGGCDIVNIMLVSVGGDEPEGAR